MAEILKLYVKTLTKLDVEVVFKGSGNDKTGTMVLPKGRFTIDEFAYAVELTGYVPRSDQSRMPQYAQYDDSTPARVKLVNEIGGNIGSWNTNSNEMMSTLKMILPIIASSVGSTSASAAHAPSVETILLEILNAVNSINNKIR